MMPKKVLGNSRPGLKETPSRGVPRRESKTAACLASGIERRSDVFVLRSKYKNCEPG